MVAKSASGTLLMASSDSNNQLTHLHTLVTKARIISPETVDESKQ